MCEVVRRLFADQLHNFLKACHDLVIIFLLVRELTVCAVLDAGLGVAEIAAALPSQRIERTVAEQTVEVLLVRARMAGEILTFPVLKNA